MQINNIAHFRLQEQSEFVGSRVIRFPVIPRRIMPGDQNPRIWHQHDCMEIALVTSGTAVHILENHSAPIREGDLLLIGPNIVHGYDECDTLGLYNVLYDSTKLPVPTLDAADIPMFRQFLPTKFDATPQNFSAQPVANIPTPEQLTESIRQIDRIATALTTPLPGNMFACFVRLLDFLLSAMRFVTSAEPPVTLASQWIFPMEEILAYLNKNYTRRIPLETLVKMSNLSERSFQYKFKRLTGQTVSEYLLQKRLAHAKTMLANDPNASIQDVAFDSGFEDPNYFTRQFKKAFDCPPGQFRRNATKAKSTI